MKKLFWSLFTAVTLFFGSMGLAFAVDANKATQAELEAVSGIGPVLAGRILEERKKGNFKDLKDLETRVKGIGEENVKKMAAAGLAVGGGGAPKAEAKADAKKDAPKAAAGAKDAPKAEPKADAKKDAPKADAKMDAKKDAPKADAKADAKKDAPKADAKKDAPKADAKADKPAAKADSKDDKKQ